MLSTESDSDCWVDVFDADYFLGRRRRLTGPKKLGRIQARSLIVGPGATLVLSVIRNHQPAVIRLSPKRLIPDVDNSLGSAILSDVTVEPLD